MGKIKLNQVFRENRAIFEATGTIMAVLDEDGTIALINSELERASGYKTEEVTGRPLTDFVYRDDREMTRIYHSARKTNPGLAPRNYECRMVRKDGRIRNFHVTVNAIPGMPCYIASFMDITERKLAEEGLKIREYALQKVSKDLAETESTLRVLRRANEKDRMALEDQILFNMKELVLPCLKKLKSSRLTPAQAGQLDILETNLHDILSPFLRNLAAKYPELTPREIEIAALITEGRTTKEIAVMLNASTRTIDFHRDNIRTKLGLKSSRTNLRAFLLALQ